MNCPVCDKKLTGKQTKFCSIRCGNISFKRTQLWLKKKSAIETIFIKTYNPDLMNTYYFDLMNLKSRTLSLLMTELGFKFKYNQWVKPQLHEVIPVDNKDTTDN